jgi:hypothetical protein
LAVSYPKGMGLTVGGTMSRRVSTRHDRLVQLLGLKRASLGLKTDIVRYSPYSFEREVDGSPITRLGLVARKTAMKVLSQVPGSSVFGKLVHNDLSWARSARRLCDHFSVPLRRVIRRR